jgi:hypothetical protein
MERESGGRESRMSPFGTVCTGCEGDWVRRARLGGGEDVDRGIHTNQIYQSS